MIEWSRSGYLWLMNPDLGGPKTYGSHGSGSAKLILSMSRSVSRAVEYEVARQIHTLEAGGQVRRLIRRIIRVQWFYPHEPYESRWVDTLVSENCPLLIGLRWFYPLIWMGSDTSGCAINITRLNKCLLDLELKIVVYEWNNWGSITSKSEKKVWLVLFCLVWCLWCFFSFFNCSKF